MRLGDTRLGRGQKGGADLCRACPQRQRGGDAAPVGDAARGDHRHADSRNHLWHQRHGAHHGAGQIGAEPGPVATRLSALRDHRVDPRRLERLRLGDAGGGAHHQHAALPGAVDDVVGHDAKGKAEDRGAAVQHLLYLRLEIELGPVDRSGRGDPQRLVMRTHEIERGAWIGGKGWRIERREQVDGKARIAALAHAGGIGADPVGLQIGHPHAAQSAGLAHRHHHLGRVAATGHRRLDDRMVERETLHQAVSVHVGPCLAGVALILGPIVAGTQ